MFDTPSLPLTNEISNLDFILRSDLRKVVRYCVDILKFHFRHLLPNFPCILCSKFTDQWRALRQWVDHSTGGPNFEFLRANFGTDSVPILIGTDAFCAAQMPLNSFINEYFTVHPNDGRERRKKIAYLKDWHFQSAHPEENDLYELPAFLRSDWANNEWWTPTDQSPFEGDYRFVYFGTEGSWTPFHSDVLNSFSWSANVCGRKLWYLLRPGAEHRVRSTNDAYPKDIRECLGHFEPGELFQFVQEPGQIVFVPSGWWHQVHNLEASISINHNVINVFNLHHLVALMYRRLEEVRAEISDVRELMAKDEFDSQCELILWADFKMNREKLLRLMELVIESRGDGVEAEEGKHLLLTNDWPNFDSSTTDGKGAEILDWARKVGKKLSKSCKCEQHQQQRVATHFCSSCADFIRRFELIRASEVRQKLHTDPFYF